MKVGLLPVRSDMREHFLEFGKQLDDFVLGSGLVVDHQYSNWTNLVEEPTLNREYISDRKNTGIHNQVDLYYHQRFKPLKPIDDKNFPSPYRADDLILIDNQPYLTTDTLKGKMKTIYESAVIWFLEDEVRIEFTRDHKWNKTFFRVMGEIDPKWYNRDIAAFASEVLGIAQKELEQGFFGEGHYHDKKFTQEEVLSAIEKIVKYGQTRAEPIKPKE